MASTVPQTLAYRTHGPSNFSLRYGTHGPSNFSLRPCVLTLPCPCLVETTGKVHRCRSDSGQLQHPGAWPKCFVSSSGGWKEGLKRAGVQELSNVQSRRRRPVFSLWVFIERGQRARRVVGLRYCKRPASKTSSRLTGPNPTLQRCSLATAEQGSLRIYHRNETS